MTAERHMGERLSEQTTAAMDWARAWAKYPGDDPQVEIGRYFLSLARQLAEAERENERLRAFVSDLEAKGLRADLNPTMNLRSAPEVYENFARYLRHIDGGIKLRARAALRPPDPPASPAEGSEDDHARAEHLREAREVEDHQERKHAARESG